MDDILANRTTSISSFKANPNRELMAADDEPFCVLTNNRPSFYVLSAKAWEELQEQIEDLELTILALKAEAESDGTYIPVKHGDITNLTWQEPQARD